MIELMILVIAPLSLLAFATWLRWKNFQRSHPAPRISFHLSDLVAGTLIAGVTLLISYQMERLHNVERPTQTICALALVLAGLAAGKLWYLTTSSSKPLPSAAYMAFGLAGCIALEFVCMAGYAFYILTCTHWCC